MIALGVIVAIVDWLGKIATAINQLYELYKNVDEFNKNPDWFSDPNGLERQQFNQQMEQIKMSRQQILDACANIQDAIAHLDKTVFLVAISDRLGDADQAQQALDNWLRTGNALQQGFALDHSAGALADLLQFSSTGAYSNVSLVVPLLEVLLTRVLILAKADPGFITSSLARKPIEDSIRLIRATAVSLEAQILDGNRVQETQTPSRQVRIDPDTGAKTITLVVSVAISYQNISGTVAYFRSEEFEAIDSAGYKPILDRYRAEALAARASGLADDLRRAQLVTMRDVAYLAEKIVRDAEIRQIERIIGRGLTLIERSQFRILRRSANLRQSTIEIADRYFLETDFPLEEPETVRRIGDEVLDRDLTDPEEQAVIGLARTFGAKAALHALLNHADSVLNDRAEPPSVRATG